MTEHKNPMELDADFFEKQNQITENEFMNSFKENEYPTNKKEEESTDDDFEIKNEDFDQALESDEKEELKRLNEVLGTSETNLIELRKKINTINNQKADNSIQDEIKLSNYFESLLKLDKEDLLIENEKMLAHQRNEEFNLEDVQLKIEKWKENDLLDVVYNSIAGDIKKANEDKQNKIKAYNQTKQDTESNLEKAAKENLQDAVINFSKDGFGGFKPTKEEAIDIYKKISKENIKGLSKEDISSKVEYEFFKLNKEKIKKRTEGPTYSQGIESTLKEMGMRTESSNGEKSKNNDGDLGFIESFIK